MPNIGIYVITSPTNKVYVGQSWDLGKRKNVYKNLSCLKQPGIYNSLAYHGWEAHKFEVVLELHDDISQEWMDYWEVFFWQYYKEGGFEMLNAIKPGSHGKYSEEAKQSRRGKSPSQETRNKISKSLTGKIQPRDVVEKRAEALRGRVVSEETKHKISVAQKGIVNVGTKSAKAVCVLQFTKQGEFIKEWGAISEASKELKIKSSHISACCRSKERRKFVGGFKWVYK